MGDTGQPPTIPRELDAQPQLNRVEVDGRHESGDGDGEHNAEAHSECVEQARAAGDVLWRSGSCPPRACLVFASVIAIRHVVLAGQTAP